MTNLVKTCHGINERQHPSIRDEWYCCIIAMRLGWKMVDELHGTFLLYCAKRSRSLIGWETPCERRIGEPSKGPVIPFGPMIKYHAISAEDQSRLLQLGKKVLLGIFMWYALYAGRKSGNEMIWSKIQSSHGLRLPSTFQTSSVRLSRNKFKVVFVVLTTPTHRSGTGSDSSLGTRSLTLGSTWWRQM